MTSNGMSSHGSNGLGSVVVDDGLLIVVGGSIGAAVDRSCTARAADGGRRRTLPDHHHRRDQGAERREQAQLGDHDTPSVWLASIAGSVQVAPAPPQVNENMF